MNTRRQAKMASKYCKSEGSITQVSPPSTFSSAYQIESDTSKGFAIENIRTQVRYDQDPIKQRIIWEEDYNQLMAIYNNLSAPSITQAQAANALFSQLTQFSASELLLKSQAPLWVTQKDHQILQSFSQTIVALSSLDFRCALIEKDVEKYLAVEISGSRKEFRLLPVEPFALQFFQKRQVFLSQFKQKCLGQQTNKLSQLSIQIIFLYHQYHRMRQRILGKINAKCSQVSERKTDYEETIKQLTKQLRLLRKARKNL